MRWPQAARSAPLPEISQGGQGQQRPSEANVEDQVVLSDHRTDADLIDERDLAEILNLHKAKPEVRPAPTAVHVPARVPLPHRVEAAHVCARVELGGVAAWHRTAVILPVHKCASMPPPRQIWDAAALAAKYNANVHMLTAVLSSVTLPVHVKDENDTYGVWDVLD